MNPVFSVVIPTFNRPLALQRCLRALCRQSYAEPFELIVVNDGGSALPDFPMPPRESVRLLLLHQPNSGPAAARNLGAGHAKGKFLAFTDDDCEPSVDWLDELSRNLRADPLAMVGGRSVNALAGNSCSAASQLLIDFLYAFYVRDGLPQFFTSNNIAVARGAFTDIGRFDEHFPLPAAEDREFCARWRTAGRRAIYAPGAVIHHYHDLTPTRFFLQHFQYGRGACQFRRRRAQLSGERIRLESLAFYLNLVGYPLRSGTGSAVDRLEQTMLFLVSQIANAAGFFSERLWSDGSAQRKAAGAQEVPVS
jgi:GT2 family glycosyltransferase